MVAILKKLFENDIDMSIEKPYGGKDELMFQLRKTTVNNTYVQNVFIKVNELDELNEPDSYLNTYLNNRIDDFIKNIDRIESVKPADIDILHP